MLTHDHGVSIRPPHGEPTSIPVPPGGFFLTVIDGWMGRTAAAGQAITRGGCLYTHAGIYRGGGRIVQAEPGGARERNFDDLYWGRPVLWSDAPIQLELDRARRALNGDVDLAELDHIYRQRVVDAAVDLVGAPYGWLDYAVIAAAEWRVPGWERLIQATADRGNLICSALVDLAYTRAGVQLFTDDRPRGRVTPSDLARIDDTWMRRRLADLESRVSKIEGLLA